MFENVKWLLAKTWKYISGVPKLAEEEKKEKNLKAACDSKEYDKNKDKEVFGKWQVGWPWLQHDHNGESKLLGEWKLIQATGFWGVLARMESALKIKCPTLFW